MQQVPGDAIWRLYNLGKLLAAGALPRTPLGELPEPCWRLRLTDLACVPL